MSDSYASSPLMDEVKTPSVKPIYVTRTFAGKGGNISMTRPGGGGLNRRVPTGVSFQKARKRRK